MPYATIQAIRESAGLLSRSQNETPTGAIDGSNKDFVVRRRPIVDSNNDDKVTVADVNVFVNGAPVEVAEVSADDGKISLSEAPTTGQKVTVDYCFSPITDEYTGGKQDEADSWVDLKIKAYAKLPLNPVPGIISTAAEMYAAGLILTRDWGSRVDSELTSKDGFNKIKQARDLIADYIQGLKDNNATTNQTTGDENTVSAASDHGVFPRHENELRHYRGGPLDDEFFDRRR